MQIPPPRTGAETISSEQRAAILVLIDKGLQKSAFPQQIVGRILKDRPEVVQEVMLAGLARMVSMECPQFAFDHAVLEASAETGAC